LHPDKNKAAGETELFLGVQQAYEALANAQRRAQYDATLPAEKRLSFHTSTGSFAAVQV